MSTGNQQDSAKSRKIYEGIANREDSLNILSGTRHKEVVDAGSILRPAPGSGNTVDRLEVACRSC